MKHRPSSLLAGVEICVRVASLSLIGRAAVIVPNRKFINRLWSLNSFTMNITLIISNYLVQSFSFRPESLSCSIHPNVEGLDPVNIDELC